MVVMVDHWVAKATNGGDILRISFDGRAIMDLHLDNLPLAGMVKKVENLLTALTCPIEFIVRVIAQL